MSAVQASIKGGMFGWLSKRRFPTLLVIAAALLISDMFLPDPIPFVDEIFLMVVTAGLAAWRKRPDRRADAERVVIDHDTQKPI
jgi:hypothetical protein